MGYTQNHNCQILTSFYFNFSNSIQRSITVFYEHKKLMIYYMVPSFLYCLYNNLPFKNLSHFDPTTYLLLLQSRLLMTGIIFQVISLYMNQRCDSGH